MPGNVAGGPECYAGGSGVLVDEVAERAQPADVLVEIGRRVQLTAQLGLVLGPVRAGREERVRRQLLPGERRRRGDADERARLAAAVEHERAVPEHTEMPAHLL